jgi:hypothetical protein
LSPSKVDTTDESGVQGSNHPDPLYCLGGLLICENDWKRVNDDVDILKFRHFKSASVEIHTANLYKHKGDFINLIIPHAEEVLDDIYTLISHSNVVLFTVLIDKPKLEMIDSNQNPEFVAWKLLLERVNLCIKNQCVKNGKDEKGLIITDEKGKKENDRLRTYVKYCREYGTEFGKINRLIEEPLFTPSEWRNLTQLADAIVYCAKNSHMGEPFFMSQFHTIAGKFDCDPAGKIDGYGFKVYPK